VLGGDGQAKTAADAVRRHEGAHVFGRKAQGLAVFRADMDVRGCPLVITEKLLLADLETEIIVDFLSGHGCYLSAQALKCSDLETTETSLSC